MQKDESKKYFVSTILCCGYRQLTIFAISEMIQPSAGQSSGYETEHEFGGSSFGSEARLDGECPI